MSFWTKIFGGNENDSKPILQTPSSTDVSIKLQAVREETKKDSLTDHKEASSLPARSEPRVFQEKAEDFIRSCFFWGISGEEIKDNRSSSDFKEIEEIDSLHKESQSQEALSLCLKSMKHHEDSFLFYLRAAKIYDVLKRHDDAEGTLQIGFKISLSKCSIAAAIGDRASINMEYRRAIRWWIRGCVLQLNSKILIEPMPFLKLAYACQPFGLIETTQLFFRLADRASNLGPIRLNPDAAGMCHQLVQNAMAAGDDAILKAITEFNRRYKNIEQVEGISQPRIAEHGGIDGVQEKSSLHRDAYILLISKARNALSTGALDEAVSILESIPVGPDKKELRTLALDILEGYAAPLVQIALKDEFLSEVPGGQFDNDKRNIHVRAIGEMIGRIADRGLIDNKDGLLSAKELMSVVYHEVSKRMGHDSRVSGLRWAWYGIRGWYP